MARKNAAKRPYEAALLRRYQHDLESIRASYIAAADNLGLDDVALELRRQARAGESDYRLLQRKFRSDVAAVKRKGLFGKGVSARTANPTAALSKTLNEVWDVLSGRRKAIKITPVAAARLKEEGFRVKNGRVLVSPSYKVDKKTGAVTQAHGVHVIEQIRLRANVERQIDRLWSGLGPNEYVTFSVYGNFSNIYAATPAGRDAMLMQLLAYRPAEVPNVAVLYLPNEAAAMAHVRANDAEKFARRDAREAARRRDRRAARSGRKRGIRKTRGK